MKNCFQVFILLFIAGIYSCTKKQPAVAISQPGQALKTSKVLVLKVNYLDYGFLGGQELTLKQELVILDTLPVKVDYKDPLDFGNILFTFRPTGDSLFYGTIFWMASGACSFPKDFNPPAKFDTLGYMLKRPDIQRFQTMKSPIPAIKPLNYVDFWKAVHKLKILRNYLGSKKRIGLYLYTPSVGLGNPKEWYYILFFL